MRKIKLFAIMTIVIMSLTLLAACGSKTTETKNTDNNTNQQSSVDTSSDSKAITLELVTEDNYAPIEWSENGEVKGISVDTAREAFKRAGIQVNITAYPWARALEMVTNGDADGIFSTYDTSSRREVANFPKEPIENEIISLFVLKDSGITFDGDLTKLSNYTFGSVRGFSAGQTFDDLAKAGTLKVDPSENTQASLEKLLNKRGVDIVVNNKFVVLNTLKNMGKLDQVVELKPEVVSQPAYLAFTKKRTDLDEVMAKYDKAMTEMKADGTLQQIIDKYIK